MRVYLDEDLTPTVAEVLRRRGIDAKSAHEVGHRGWTDEAQLEYAAGERRTIVSRNREHFMALGHAAIERGRPHAGIAVFSDSVLGDEIGKMVDGLIRLAELYPDGLGPYDVVYVPTPAEKP